MLATTHRTHTANSRGFLEKRDRQAALDTAPARMVARVAGWLGRREPQTKKRTRNSGRVRDRPAGYCHAGGGGFNRKRPEDTKGTEAGPTRLASRRRDAQDSIVAASNEADRRRHGQPGKRFGRSAHSISRLGPPHSARGSVSCSGSAAARLKGGHNPAPTRKAGDAKSPPQTAGGKQCTTDCNRTSTELRRYLAETPQFGLVSRQNMAGRKVGRRIHRRSPVRTAEQRSAFEPDDRDDDR